MAEKEIKLPNDVDIRSETESQTSEAIDQEFSSSLVSSLF